VSKQKSIYQRMAQVGPWLLAAVVFRILFFPNSSVMHSPSEETNCKRHLKQLGMALLMYSSDYDGRLPRAEHWEDGLHHYHKNLSLLACPGRPDVEAGYAYNLLLNRRLMKDSSQPSQTPAIFDSSLGQHNAADRLQSFTKPHGFSEAKTGVVLFLDGHVRPMEVSPRASAGFALPKPVGKPSSGGNR
jgi:prepilin-type processing-associated H-X9-DG protein